MLYRMDGPLARAEGAPDWKGEIGIFTEAELQREPELVPVRLPSPSQARYCFAGMEGNALIGSAVHPDGTRRFSFALWNGNLALVDESGLARNALEGMIGRPATPGLALCAVFWALLRPEAQIMEDLESRAEAMETEALSEEAQASRRFGGGLIGLRKRVSSLSRYYAQFSDMIDALTSQEQGDGFSPEETRDLARLGERARRLREEALSLREYLLQIRELYQAQIGIRQNEIMKFLTVVTSIFLPLSLLAGWYGMNFRGMPELSWPLGYPLFIGISLCVAGLCVWYFKKKRFL